MTLTRKDTLSMAKPEGLSIDSKPTRPFFSESKIYPHTDHIKRDARIIALITSPWGPHDEGEELNKDGKVDGLVPESGQTTGMSWWNYDKSTTSPFQIGLILKYFCFPKTLHLLAPENKLKVSLPVVWKSDLFVWRISKIWIASLSI